MCVSVLVCVSCDVCVSVCVSREWVMQDIMTPNSLNLELNLEDPDGQVCVSYVDVCDRC